MERRKAANNEIFDILLKSALITRYEMKYQPPCFRQMSIPILPNFTGGSDK